VKTKLMRHFRELEMYQSSIAVAMHIFEMSKSFPAEERYWLIDQVRRSSRSACANVAKDWRKRRYKAAFISNVSDTETEATETQVWCEVAYFGHYIKEKTFVDLSEARGQIVAQPVRLSATTDRWTTPTGKNARTPTRPHADR
jgi:four helix bundle protein